MYISGRGTLFVLDITQNGVVPVNVYDWNDGLFDVTWAENNENLIIAGAGDGSVLLFDVKNAKVYTAPDKSSLWLQIPYSP